MRPPSRAVRQRLRPLTVPASRLYGSIIAARNRRFDRGAGIQRIDRPVISVGNLSVGGTGKSPVVAWIARTLREAGHRPAIAMRGYRAPRGQAGDEELEYRALLPDVPVVANPDRVRALRSFLPSHVEIDCVILDDGFQHRRLHRDLDLVLIDAAADTFNDELLPAGTLREPLTSLARATAVLVTHADGVDSALAQEIARWHGRHPMAWSQHTWRSLDVVCGTAHPVCESDAAHAHQGIDVSWLEGKRVVTMLGIGRPDSVVTRLESLGATVMASVPARDHERYDRAKIITARGLAEGLDALIVTRKDWVKIQPLLASSGREWTTPILVPNLQVTWIRGVEALTRAVLECARGG